MKTHKNLYKKLCSIENLTLAYKKARRGKSKKASVLEFEKNLDEEIRKLHEELTSFTYVPLPLKRFIIRDPKTRVIHASAFIDRVVHHALINIISPVLEKTFIYDSYASQINKGTHSAVKRFDYFKRKVSRNGKVVKRGEWRSRNSIEGYCLKIDIKHYFDTIDHEILVRILRKKIKDEGVMWLTKRILNNFDTPSESKGMPLGNYTSQFLANVYLNELDYFVKHHLRVKYYLRYVDDFIILHRSRKRLEFYRKMIDKYLRLLKLEIHPEKSDIIPLKKGVSFLGYRVFYHHRLLRKRNLRTFQRRLERRLNLYKKGLLTKDDLFSGLQGWFGYSQWASTYKLRRKILEKVEGYEEGDVITSKLR